MVKKVVLEIMKILQIGQIWNNDDGFTFLEILVVLAIISVALTMVLPNFINSFQNIESARASKRILRILEKVRAEAILKAENQEVSFYGDGRTSFEYQGKSYQYELGVEVILDNQEQEKLVQTFYPDGTAKLERLTFLTEKGNYLIYTFNPVTGKIEKERSSRL